MTWSATDSLYGSRHLANKWYHEFDAAGNSTLDYIVSQQTFSFENICIPLDFESNGKLQMAIRPKNFQKTQMQFF